MSDGDRRRGRLTVYLGAAPGVGKTYAMLGEAQRRRERGTDIVVGLVETHGRQLTEAMVGELEVVPRRVVEHRGATFTELDVDAVVARDPAVVCVDELAHTNVPGSRHEKRAADVQELLERGIDVITTVNIQHLESLNDEVERITGVRQRETVPDEVVRAADQVQLVDMAPDALRRRMAHGNIYPAERVDASLTSYFRTGNLTALRELALLWLADRVDDALGDYRRAHDIDHPWPTKERIVVALTGGTESETLLRRGARLAQRAKGSELIAVHVIAADGLQTDDRSRIARAQQLVASLGGSFHSVVGDDVAPAVVDFATAANATMIIVGVSRHSRLRRLFAGTTGDRIAQLAGAIDVHLVTHDQVARSVRRGSTSSPLSRRRQAAGWIGAVVVPLVLTWVLGSFQETDQLPLAEMLLLAGTVVVALVGGLRPALVAAVISFFALNWYFTPPTGVLTVAEPANLLALIVYVAVAAGVATVVDLASRRAGDALRARTEAATMSSLSRSVLTGQDTAEAIVERVRETFGQDAVTLLERRTTGWVPLATAGETPPDRPDAGTSQVDVDDDHLLCLRGETLRSTDRRVLEAFAVQTSLVLEYRRLRERDQRAALLESAQSTSTALLRAVGHDLRTPLATIRASVDGLSARGLSADDRAELEGSLVDGTDRLEHLIDDLLDLSRLQSGLVEPHLVDRSLDEVLPLAVSGHPPGAVVLDVDEPAPVVRTDAGLLERVVANLVSNAVRASRAVEGAPAVRVMAHVLPTRVEVVVVDRGRGVPPEQRERMFAPFQRLSDHAGPEQGASTGLGLGLAVAQGLTTALGGEIAAEDTPGGGLTMVVSLPRGGGS
ncbi:ATP-binding protein [Nocardioides marmoraquaticus]